MRTKLQNVLEKIGKQKAVKGNITPIADDPGIGGGGDGVGGGGFGLGGGGEAGPSLVQKKTL